MAATDRDVLPDNVKPVNYDISIYGIELGGEFGFQGTVKIELHLKEKTTSIKLNVIELKLKLAKFTTKDGAAQESVSISYEENAQRATIDFGEEICADGILEIQYSGTMNNNMAGFYRSRYEPTVPPAASVPRVGDFHYMFSTQFESCDCRRAVPCFDEPNLKATFDFEIEIPDDQTALSNMPEKSTRAGQVGRKVVSFERTPVMSTYLLAWAFGDFEYVEAFTERKYSGKNLPVRVYTTRGLKEQGRFSLDHAHKLIDYYSDIFQIEYPLPKADLLCVHEFSHGAMENWGLVTYRAAAILFDEKTADSQRSIRTGYIVAHELAHQWFGNLVTMDWWSELWLNEGFATWVGWLATNHLHPEWEVWAQFVGQSVQQSMSLDSLRGSHPIEVPVKNALEIDQIFDAISYRKGSSVIRMLSAHLGTKTFFQGVSDYLKAHAYGNATTNDLWNALSKASGLDVNSFMDNWIRIIGFPVVIVTEEPGQITVRQSRFLSTGDVKPEEDETLWWVPLGLKSGADASATAVKALETREDTVRNIDESFYKLNSDVTGFYRTDYPPDRLAKLGAAREKLSIEDRIGLVGDAAALAIAGNATSASLLALTAEFQDETNFYVWEQVLGSLDTLQSVFSPNEEVSAGLKRFVLELVTPAVEKLGWEMQADEGILTGSLRSLLITSAAGSGHQGVISEARRRFRLFASGDREAVHPNIRLSVFKVAVSNGGIKEYEDLKKDYLETSSAGGKEILLVAMGKVQDIKLVQDYMDFQSSEKVAIQDAHIGVYSLAMNPKARYAMWDYIKAHWEAIHARLSANSVVLDRYLKISLAAFSDLEVENDIAKFFEGKDTKGYDRGLVQISDTIKRNSAYRTRDEKLILEWLKTKNYG